MKGFEAFAIVAFVILVAAVFTGLLYVYGAGTTSAMQYKYYSNNTSYSDVTSLNGTMQKPPACDLGNEGWSLITDVPTCAWNYASYGFGIAGLTTGDSTLDLVIVVPLLIIFMFGLFIVIIK